LRGGGGEGDKSPPWSPRGKGDVGGPGKRENGFFLVKGKKKGKKGTPAWPERKKTTREGGRNCMRNAGQEETKGGVGEGGENHEKRGGGKRGKGRGSKEKRK